MREFPIVIIIITIVKSEKEIRGYPFLVYLLPYNNDKNINK